MAQPLSFKRITRERQNLEKPNPDYYVRFKDENILSFDAYIFGPDDSLYSNKVVKVHFDIPSDYPFSPPKAGFIQHSGGRIHPNLYVEGKICLSILGTWPGEPWAQSMGIDTGAFFYIWRLIYLCNDHLLINNNDTVVLITIRSLLDKEPFKHEPGQKNDPGFNKYVEYATWQYLLLDYLDRESDPELRQFLFQYVQRNGDKAKQELQKQSMRHGGYGSDKELVNRYGRNRVTVNYPKLLQRLEQAMNGVGKNRTTVECEAISMSDEVCERVKVWLDSCGCVPKPPQPPVSECQSENMKSKSTVGNLSDAAAASSVIQSARTGQFPSKRRADSEAVVDMSSKKKRKKKTPEVIVIDD
ncbi:MAG: ubiquitin-conjugating enzyme E2 Ze [Alyxoria varia]|nr:MAG: ubiquitin-conjugating enzyme E2 Ze [Alyxoria varia]